MAAEPTPGVRDPTTTRRAYPRRARARRTLPGETRIERRYAKALAEARYRTAFEAAEPCLLELRRAGLGRGLNEAEVAATLRHLSLALGRRLKYRHWNAAENRILDRFARKVASGRYASANAAIGDCRAALERAGLCDHVGERTIGNKLRHRSHQLGRRFVFLHWTPSQNRIVVRYARAIVSGRYPHAPAALPDCLSAMKAAGERIIRVSREAVKSKLWYTARKLGLESRASRWTTSEEDVGREWTRKYHRHKTGRSRMGLSTIARMMQSELRRLGFERTCCACKAYVVKTYRLGRFH
jgi:hypothetical protein